MGPCPRKRHGPSYTISSPHLERSGNVGSTIEGYVKAIKSWMAWNDIQTPRRIKLIGASENPSVENEVTPVRQELRKIFEVATIRGKATCSMMAFGAFRPEVLGNFVGDDGLKIGDLPEMKIQHKVNEQGEVVDGTVSFEKVPAMVVVRKPLSKVGHQYFAFLPEEGCRYLKNYLEWRLRPKEVRRPMNDGRRPQVIKLPGEKLEPGSPLIAALKIKGTTNVTTTKIREEIKQAIVTAGFSWRPYVLRRYFEVNMMSARVRQVILSRMEGVLDRTARQHLGCLYGEQGLARGRIGDDEAGLCAGSGEAPSDRSAADDQQGGGHQHCEGRSTEDVRLHRPGAAGARRHHADRHREAAAADP